jgi:hypothetical protein
VELECGEIMLLGVSVRLEQGVTALHQRVGAGRVGAPGPLGELGQRAGRPVWLAEPDGGLDLRITADVRASEPHMLYHMPMARKEVLVQLDDELVRRLDALAAKAGVSRSELLRRGAIAVLEASELAEADQALIDSYRRQPQDPAIVAAAARLAAQTAPKW